MSEMSYTTLDNFFRELAQKHVDINDYCGTSAEELAQKITSVNGVVSPILVFFNYSGKLYGTQQRTFNNRLVSFAIMFTGIKTDEFPEQRTAVNAAERIGLEILARINIQSKMPNIGWLYNNFDKELVTYDEIENEGEDEYYGMEFHFQLKNHEPLTVDKTKWSDGDIFC